MNKHYQNLVRKLSLHGVSMRLIEKTWKKRPQELEQHKAVLWFKKQLILRGYVAENVLVEIDDEFIDPENEMITTDTRFSRFTLHEEIGHGGMGKVFRAFDPSLDKEIALKILNINSSQKMAKRFIFEGQILANLHHRNIVKFYEIDMWQNQYYLTMDYIKGYTLREWLLQYKPKISTVVNIFSKICTAIDDVHNLGIIHRDIKPENIMISTENEPIILDFGIAKKRQTNFSTISIMGTPDYMSPEQAQDQEIDCRSDIFSLGVMLYEMLTGRLPFVGKNDFEVFKAVIYEDPISPKLLNPQVDVDLETICLKSLQKECSQRYQRAKDIVLDIKRFQNHEVIMAKPTKKWRKTVKWVKRNKLTTFVAAFLTIVIIGVLSLYIATMRNFSQQNAIAARTANLRMAKIVLAKAGQMYHDKKWQEAGILAGACLELTKSLPETEKITTHAQELVRLSLLKYPLLWKKAYRGYAYKPKYTFRNEKNFVIVDTATGREITSFRHPDRRLRRPLVSNDFRLFAFHAGNTIKVFNTQSLQFVAEIPASQNAVNLAIDSGNKYLLYCENSPKVMMYLWDLRTEQQIDKYEFKSKMTTPTFNKQATKICVGDLNTLWVIDIASRKLTKLVGHSNAIAQTLFINDEKILSCTEQGELRIWDVKRQRQLWARSNHGAVIAISKSGDMFASSHSGKTYVWDMELGRVVNTFNVFAWKVAFVDNDEKLVCFDGKHMTCWKIFNSKRMYDIEPVSPLAVLDINYDSSVLVYWAPGKKVVHRWDIHQQKHLEDLVHPHVVNDIDFSSKRDVLLTTCADGILRLWKGNKIFAQYNVIATQVQFHPLDENIVACADKNALFLYNLKTQEKTAFTSVHKDGIRNLVFSHDGKMIVSAGHESILWDVKSGKVKQKLPYALREYPPRLGFSGDNKIVMVCDFFGAHFWNIEEQRHQQTLRTTDTNSCMYSKYYNDFFCADFKYRLSSGKYGYTIQDFYGGWVRTRWMVSSSHGIFAACIPYKIVVLKLPPMPNFRISKLPNWHREFPVASKATQYESHFSLTPKAPGWFIEEALKESPQKLTEYLFDLKLNDDLTFE